MRIPETQWFILHSLRHVTIMEQDTWQSSLVHTYVPHFTSSQAARALHCAFG